MDAKLKVENFTQIFFDSLPQILENLPDKAFENCIQNFDRPFLSDIEENCLKDFSLKYLFSVDHTLINFSKKCLE
jgi:hypothetical protein